MSKLPALKPKRILRSLVGVGFYIHHTEGSHTQLRHETKIHLRVTVPMHSNFDLPPEIVHSILKQADLSREEFLKLL